ncbi:uncharacterized protein Z520_02985 [Fonsecaea multimorphosa CBS 102226]|uniref:Uncharacterized protein n=1 Tax=Fonsecaea multimorphosa CBS 102226 TaxID=1442371 RepID=A0A0D2K6I6_9EURO|nr:uncharacterized protein Z520_02985 [Fonsecaea multimorphosa CBS 102226]KIY01433.1 hypothetical protein Z520_02985 [Fonsecaea multimorphosa CBS 102226]OAL28451.1 hypothetical protein AYO22_02905 [Fonsecaea multimorphosa]
MTESGQSNTFLFVNKSGEDASLSNSKEDRSSAIGRHVQRWRRLNRLQRSQQEGLNDFSNPRPIGTMISFDSVLPQTTHQISREGSPARADAHQNVASEPRRSSSTPVQVPRANFRPGDAVDPFNATSVRLNAEIQAILQYFISFSIPRATERTGTDESYRRHLERVPAIKKVVQGCLSNKMHMLSLLTATAARMEQVSKKSISNRHTARNLMSRAIPHIRRYLQRIPALVVDKQFILDIFYLGVCEWYLEDYDSALTHLRAAGNFINSLDPRLPFDAFVKETIVYNDIFLAAETGRKPLLVRDWDASGLGLQRHKQISRSLSANGPQCRLGRGFLDPRQNDIFTFEMNLVLCNLIPWIDVGRHALQTRTLTLEDSEWVCSKGQAMLHDLLSITIADVDREKPTPSWRAWEECVRLSLITVISLVSTQMSWRSGRINALRVRKMLESHGGSWGSRAHNQVKLWVLVTCMLVASEDCELEDWFLNAAVDAAKDSGLTTYNELHQAMSAYLYSARFQRDILANIARRQNRGGEASSRDPEESAEAMATDTKKVNSDNDDNTRGLRKQTLGTFGFNLSSETGRMLW